MYFVKYVLICLFLYASDSECASKTIVYLMGQIAQTAEANEISAADFSELCVFFMSGKFFFCMKSYISQYLRADYRYWQKDERIRNSSLVIYLFNFSIVFIFCI